MSIGIYKITNLINNKSYIGQSCNIEKRIKTHFWAAFKENLSSYNYKIYQAIRKYGIENFKWEILKTINEVNKGQLNILERQYIEKYDSFKNGYNMTTGGDVAEQNLNSGENNGKAKLTEQDVIDIREAYNNHVLKRDVYPLYQDKIGESGFHKIWNFETWKNIHPEYHSKENIAWHSSNGRVLSSEQASLNASKIKKEDIYLIREMYDEGLSSIEISELLTELPIQYEEIRRICKRERFRNI